MNGRQLLADCEGLDEVPPTHARKRVNKCRTRHSFQKLTRTALRAPSLQPQMLRLGAFVIDNKPQPGERPLGPGGMRYRPCATWLVGCESARRKNRLHTETAQQWVQNS